MKSQNMINEQTSDRKNPPEEPKLAYETPQLQAVKLFTDELLMACRQDGGCDFQHHVVSS